MGGALQEGDDVTVNELDNRFAEGYQPNWDIDKKVGDQGELFVRRIVTGLESGSIEVKTDEKARLTGNVFVEFRCRYRGRYEKSGLAVTTAEFWAFVVGINSMAIIVSVELLKDLCKELLYNHPRRGGEMGVLEDSAYYVKCVRGSHPTHGVRVPIKTLLEWSLNPPSVESPKLFE